jgi:PD-(D/E)XK endonuclease
MTIEGGRVPRHFSLRGEWVELRFMARAAEYEIRAIKPWGDCSRYDFIVESRGRFLRVQVKSTSHVRGKQYTCGLGGANRRPYSKEEIDFLAVFVIPVDTWYIIPIEVVGEGTYNISVSPHNSLSRYAPYREAWHLLLGERPEKPALLP